MLFNPASGLGHIQGEVHGLQQEVARKANDYDLHSTNSNVDRLERTVRELCFTVDELRARVQELEAYRLRIALDGGDHE